MEVKVILFLFLVLLIIGCSKEETSTTGLSTATGQVVSETTVTITEQAAVGCSDSDGGLTKETAGKVSGVKDGEEYTVYDRCIAGLLVEYYCEGDSYQNQNLRCPEGTECLSGACR